MKQISIRLPPNTYHTLRKEASKTKRTINGQILWWLELGQEMEQKATGGVLEESTSSSGS